MIVGSQVSDNTAGNDPTQDGSTSSVFNNVIATIAADTASVYRTINAPPTPTYQQQQQSKQSTLLIVGVLIIGGLIAWHLSEH